MDIENHKDGAGHTNGQPGDIDNGIALLVFDLPQDNLDVVPGERRHEPGGAQGRTAVDLVVLDVTLSFHDVSGWRL